MIHRERPETGARRVTAVSGLSLKGAKARHSAREPEGIRHATHERQSTPGAKSPVQVEETLTVGTGLPYDAARSAADLKRCAASGTPGRCNVPPGRKAWPIRSATEIYKRSRGPTLTRSAL